MRKQISIFFITTFLLIVSANAQKIPMRFGIQFKPIIPLNFMGMKQQAQSQGDISSTLKQQFGFSFGMDMRKSFTKTFAVEAGINLVKRRYLGSISEMQDNYKTSITLTTYEIPIQGLVYVQMNDAFFVNGSAGFSLNFLPSDYYTNEDLLESGTFKKGWIKPALTANFGVEYRTEDNGSFYVGFSYMRPFSDIAITELEYKKYAPLKFYDFFFNDRGDYITLDLRYFFPVNKKQ